MFVIVSDDNEIDHLNDSYLKLLNPDKGASIFKKLNYQIDFTG